MSMNIHFTLVPELQFYSFKSFEAPFFPPFGGKHFDRLLVF